MSSITTISVIWVQTSVGEDDLRRQFWSSDLTTVSIFLLSFMLYGSRRTYITSSSLICIRIHSEWEGTGGCYWVCAEESFRHYMLHLLYIMLTLEVRCDVTSTSDALNSTFNEALELTTHPLLKERLYDMQKEIEEFLALAYQLPPSEAEVTASHYWG